MFVSGWMLLTMTAFGETHAVVAMAVLLHTFEYFFPDCDIEGDD